MGKKEKIGHQELVEFLNVNYGIEKRMAAKMVEGLIGYMETSVLSGLPVHLRGFLTLDRVSVQPKIKKGFGRVYDVPEKYKPRVTFSRMFLKSMNGEKVKLPENAEVRDTTKREEDFELNLDLLSKLIK